MNVAILRLADVVASSRHGKTAEGLLRDRIAGLEKAAAQADRAALKAQAEARHSKGPAEAEERARNASRLKREAEHRRSEADIEIDTLRQKLLHDVLRAIEPIVRGLAVERKLDLVQLVPNPGIAYFNPELDITAEVARRFDASSGVDGAGGRDANDA